MKAKRVYFREAMPVVPGGRCEAKTFDDNAFSIDVDGGMVRIELRDGRPVFASPASMVWFWEPAANEPPAVEPEAEPTLTSDVDADITPPPGPAADPEPIAPTPVPALWHRKKGRH